MQKYLIQFGLFAVLLTVTLISILLAPHVGIKESLHYSLIDKHNRLKTSNSPKIIFIGGSNLPFGINSQKIEEYFQRPVTNCGINVGYGLKFMLEDIKPFIEPGDIVVLSPEYELFFGSMLYGEYPLLFQLIDIKHETQYGLGKRHLFEISKDLPFYLSGKIKSYFRRIFMGHNAVIELNQYYYLRSAFNPWGDIDVYYHEQGKNVPAINGLEGKFNIESIHEISKFAYYVFQRGASFYLSFPGIQNSSFYNIQDEIQIVFDQLQNSDISLLGKPSDFVFSDSLIFDTPYHLIKDGVDLRTRIVIEKLSTNIQRN